MLDVLLLFISGIAMVAFSPLGNPGFIGEKDGVPSLFDDPVLRSIANNRKVTVAQVYFHVIIFEGGILSHTSLSS